MPIAQINIGRLVADADSPEVADFIDNIDMINRLAERSDGFIWRLQSDAGNAIDFKIENDPRFISNMSVWRDIASLHFFTFNTLHKAIFKRRGEWFEKPERPHFAMWDVEAGVIPTLDEGLARLDSLGRMGESEEAFTWKSVQDGKFAPKG